MMGIPDPKGRRNYIIKQIESRVASVTKDAILSGVTVEIELALEKTFGLPSADAKAAATLVMSTLDCMGVDVAAAFMKSTKEGE